MSTLLFIQAPYNRQNFIEKVIVDQRLQNFEHTHSAAYILLCKLYGPNPGQNELLSLAQVVSSYLGLQLDREARRRKIVLIKWFDENLRLIEPFLRNRIVLEDSYGKVIGNDPRNSDVFTDQDDLSETDWYDCEMA